MRFTDLLSSLVTEPESYSYPRYLRAKTTVDDRALNQRVFDRFVETLIDRPGSSLRILEVGGGVGATVPRIVNALDHQPVDALTYTLVDVEPANIDTARELLPSWGSDNGYDVWGSDHRIVFSGGSIDVSIELVEADLFDYARTADEELRNAADAVVAQAVFDILDLDEALDRLRPLLAQGGLWYLPIHFDGVTAFEPPVGAGMDGWVERLYHESMTDGGAAGDAQREEGGRGGPHTGRRLLTALQQNGTKLLEAGSSDWVVFPDRDEGYPGDEAYFLHHILHFIEQELRDHPNLEDESFEQWIAERRRQIDAETLIYVAHQLDVLAQQA